MKLIKLYAYDSFNGYWVSSSEEGAVFTLTEGKWRIKYIREKTLFVSGIEIDAPVEFESEEVEVFADVEEQEEEEPFKYHGLTSRARAGMSREPNGDKFIDD